MIREFHVWKSEALSTLVELKDKVSDPKTEFEINHLIVMLDDLDVLNVWRWMRDAHAIMRSTEDERVKTSISKIMPTKEEIDKWFSEVIYV